MKTPSLIRFKVDRIIPTAVLGTGIVLGILGVIAMNHAHNVQAALTAETTSQRTKTLHKVSAVSTSLSTSPAPDDKPLPTHTATVASNTTNPAPVKSTITPTVASTSSAPPTSSAPQTTPTPPAPTELTTCWITGSGAGQKYCPYSPPVSYSADYLKYPCTKANFGNITCPPYTDMHMIQGNGGGQCYFYYYESNVQRIVFTDFPDHNSTADCLTSKPL